LASRHSTLTNGPSLHIFVPTLQCAHTCQYCQVSRSLEATGYSMSEDDIDKACDSVLQSKSEALTVEFQGGDPLLRFDLIERGVTRLSSGGGSKKPRIRFVVASTLHQLTPEMCDFFAKYRVLLSTSIDGPANIHKRNRPLPGRDSYERTVAGIQLARERLGKGVVSALMTTTKESLSNPEGIVDEYVKLGLPEIVIRPLSPYGFASRGKANQKVSTTEFLEFYARALDRVLYWNRAGVEIREGWASIMLNKLLSPNDAGYVDLQGVAAGGIAVMVYNYDGFVYPSDEARMLVETGDVSLRLGRIGTPLDQLLRSPVMEDLLKAGTSWTNPTCSDCAYCGICSPDPIGAKAEYGHIGVPVAWTEHCRRSLKMYDFIIGKLRDADRRTMALYYRWATPSAGEWEET
jgi:His-Xaa-Ser system radical SAM maturase HxsB